MSSDVATTSTDNDSSKLNVDLNANEETNEASMTVHDDLNYENLSPEGVDEASGSVHEPVLDASCHQIPIAPSPGAAANNRQKAHRCKVAEMAAKTYLKASAESKVLSKTKLQDIALMRMDELTIGILLGKGSFSNVYEISKISCHDGEKSDRNSGTSPQDDDPRRLLETNYKRPQSDAFRYAVKFLKDDLISNQKMFSVGTIDLVMEGMFLASLTHPNIIKIRGLPEGGVQSLYNFDGSTGSNKGYFLILDRLFDTLAEKIYKTWSIEHKVGEEVLRSNPIHKMLMHISKRKKALMNNGMNNLAIRLRVAIDISAALKYLHSKRIIYRDLKPENLGFDVRGDIKLFDLGLVKELQPKDEDQNGNYKLSMAGTPRYMAPECGVYEPYNLTADVYSFSMLLWEIVTLEKPLDKFDYSRLKSDVFQYGYRPTLRKIWLKGLHSIIFRGWHQNPKKRPTMDQIYNELKDMYKNLQVGAGEEVTHNRRRSTFVSSIMSAQSIRHLLNVDEKA